MDQLETLRKTVADYLSVDVSQVNSDFRLTGRQFEGSMGRANLDFLIRKRVGIKSKAVYSAQRFGELEAELNGTMGGAAPAAASEPAPPRNGTSEPAAASPPAAEPAVSSQSSVAARISCGVDIELIESLPPTVDPWEDPFYRGTFTETEIAYCSLQEKPAIHFAARWCAKEALKKCDARYFAEELKNIEVAVEESGAPYLAHRTGETAKRLPHALSLSHTPHSAIAVVVNGEALVSAPRSQAASVSAAPAPASRAAAVSEPATTQAAAAQAYYFLHGALTLGALATAILALVRTFGPGR